MDVVFNMNKTKHVVLAELFNKYIDLSHPKDYSRGVNIYINLESILKGITYKSFNDLSKMSSFEDASKQFFANVLNLLAHYRMFMNRNGIPHKIYMYLAHPTTGDFDNSDIVPTYRTTLERETKDSGIRLIRKIINTVLETLDIIFEYVQDAFLLYSNVVEPSVIPMIIKPDNDYVNLLITNDNYDYQYINSGFKILRPLRDIIVDESNVIDVLKRDARIQNSKTVNPMFLSTIFSMLGDRYRDIPKLGRDGMSGILNKINKALTDGYITDTITSPELLANIVSPDSRDLFMRNYKVTDIPSQYLRVPKHIRLMLEHKIKLDFYDVQAFIDINRKYFTEYPIMIKDVQPYSKIKGKRVKSIFE